MVGHTHHEPLNSQDLRDYINVFKQKSTLFNTWQDALRVEMITYLLLPDGKVYAYFHVVYKMDRITSEITSLKKAIEVYDSIASRFTRKEFEAMKEIERQKLYEEIVL